MAQSCIPIKYKPQYYPRTHKKDVKCFKCGKIGHIAPNCRKQKINVFFDKNYYSEASENDASSSNDSMSNHSISENDRSSTDKIENCLCQLNILIADQELLIEMIDQIEDKEAKTKFIRQIMEQSTKTKTIYPFQMLIDLNILCNNLKYKTLS